MRFFALDTLSLLAIRIAGWELSIPPHEVFPALIVLANCSTVSASAPLVSAVNAGPVRGFRYTTMRRVARSPVAPASDSIGAAIEG